MNPDLWFFLIRNTLASWLINAEFAAPFIMLIIGWKHRASHPKLTRFLPLPALLLIIAALVRQVYEQLVLPWIFISGSLRYDQMAFVLFEVLHALLLLGGFSALLWAVYYQRHIPSKEDPFGEQQINAIKTSQEADSSQGD